MSEHFETQAIRGQMDRTEYAEHSAPIFMTSSFVFDSAEEMAATFSGETDSLIYSRYNNPNTDELVSKVCALEGAEDGVATSSGMAAVFSSMAALLRSGDHVLASRAVFGSTHQILTQILSKWGIAHTYVDPAAIDQWAQHIRPETRMLVLESPSNPGLDLIDLEKAGRLCQEHGIIFNIDNCFATPYLQRPVDWGADIVVHSSTKWMDGQGRALSGLIVGKKEFIEPIRFFTRHTGPALSPFNAWLHSKSLETLAVRMERHCASALELASRLEQHPAVQICRYPFLPSHPQHALAVRQMRLGGGIVAVELKGGLDAGRKFMNALQMCTRSSNLGDARTIVTHPASTTHSKLSEAERLAVGITPGLVRISVGLEHVEDIWADLVQALNA